MFTRADAVVPVSPQASGSCEIVGTSVLLQSNSSRLPIILMRYVSYQCIHFISVGFVVRQVLGLEQHTI